jgi:hypothetical protein
MSTEITREEMLIAIRDAADDLLHMKPGDITATSISCGLGRKTKKIKGGRGFKVVSPGCKWRTKKGEDAWIAHLKKAHPRAKAAIATAEALAKW